jgi:hypothetical protein
LAIVARHQIQVAANKVRTIFRSTTAPISRVLDYHVALHYLLPHERAIITVRIHPWILAGPLSLLTGTLLLAILLSIDVVHGNDVALGAAWVACAGSLIFALTAVAEWYVRLFIVTERRLLFVRGIKIRKVSTLPVAEIDNLTFRRSLLGRVVGYGDFIIESRATDKALRKIRYIPYPEQLYLEVCALLFPDDQEDGTLSLVHPELDAVRRLADRGRRGGLGSGGSPGR